MKQLFASCQLAIPIALGIYIAAFAERITWKIIFWVQARIRSRSADFPVGQD